MSRLGRRIRKLEDPRDPRERERDRAAVQKRQEMEDRARDRYEAIASEHPERVADYEAAVEDLHHAREEHDEGTRERLDAEDTFLEAEQHFKQGWVSGHSCEDCGRAAVHYRETGYEGTCEHCGGITSYYGFWCKRVIPLENLEADIAATRRMGYEELARHLEALMQRRRRDVNEDEREDGDS